jgi:hypothetical protein
MPDRFKGNHRRWRSSEIDALLRMPKSIPLEERARLLGRTRQSVACKLSDLKRKRMGAEILTSRRGPLRHDRAARMMQLTEKISRLKRWQEQHEAA